MSEVVALAFTKENPLPWEQFSNFFIANSDESQIGSIYFSLADHIRVKLGLDSGNKKLVKFCSEKGNTDPFDIEDAIMVILKELKRFLEKDHVLRVIK